MLEQLIAPVTGLLNKFIPSKIKFSYLFKNQIPTEGYNNAFVRRAGKTNLKNATLVYLDSDLQYTHNKNFEYVLNELNTRNLKPRD